LKKTIPAENFVDGVVAITLPLNSGTYLVYVDVTWSGGGNDFSRVRYVFKIVREIEFDSIPSQSPSLYISISAKDIESQRINAAQGTTS